jgi:predicted murein hydrolase (TIGR00659 family)
MLSALTHIMNSSLAMLTLTLLAFAISVFIFKKCRMFPLFNPVLVSVILIIGVLKWANIDYQAYFSSVYIIHFLLGPATVALAVPLYRQLKYVKQSAWPLMLGLCCGSVVSVLSAVAITYGLGASTTTIMSIIPKSITTPIAMAVSSELGGIPSLTAVLVIITGIFGAIVGTGVFRLLKISDWSVQGVAMGTACHGIGTASILLRNEKAGALSGLAMGINGIVSAILIPIIWALIGYI